MPSAMITAVTAPRRTGGTDGSGGISETSFVRTGLRTTAGPIRGMAKPPSWLNKLFGGPPTRVISRLIGTSVPPQSDNVLRVAIRVASAGSCRWLTRPLAGVESAVTVNVPSGVDREVVLGEHRRGVPPGQTGQHAERGVGRHVAGSANRPVITYFDAPLTPMKR